MPYVGQSVSDFFGPVAQAATGDAARKMCDKGGEAIKDHATTLTPVKTGRLRAGWKRSPSIDMGAGWSTDISNDVEYAGYVENGTGLYGPSHAKYLIRPKNPGGMLRWVGKDGKIHFAAYVMHPGSPGRYMLATSMNVVEAEADGPLFNDVLGEWVQEVEKTASH